MTVVPISELTLNSVKLIYRAQSFIKVAKLLIDSLVLEPLVSGSTAD
jgi:hypothetical protein